MSQPTGPPPYPGVPQPNIQGPPQQNGGFVGEPYPGPPYGGQPYPGPPYGGPPYMGPQYGSAAPAPAPAPIIIMQQQQQQQQMMQSVAVRSGTNHCLCCLLCFLTGGLSLPCWIYACIVD